MVPRFGEILEGYKERRGPDKHHISDALRAITVC